MANHTPLTGYPYGAKAPFPHGSANEASERIVKSHNADEGSSHVPTGDSGWSGAGGFGWTFADSFPFTGSLLIPDSTSLGFGTDGAATISIGQGVQTFFVDLVSLSGSPTVQSRFKLGAYSRTAAHITRINSSATVNAMTQGPVIILGKPTGAQTLTLAQASDTNLATDDYFEIYMPKPGTDPASDYWIIKREGSGNNIAIMWGKYLPSAGSGDTYPAFCRVHVEGGVWRLTGGAGINYDTDA